MKCTIMSVNTDRDGVETHTVEMEYRTEDAARRIIKLLRDREEAWPKGNEYYLISTGAWS